ncbi:amidohydrolase [Reichenbachiella sp. 5M10]|uniref:amidohydrolase n=1 Tax=Reichenbachiella sp. 5M10 TaxID=1889772 RepID=UPI000C1519E6|nr:amidohydrolase [Reichenbachiella sp. 5M10]PIB36811.1 amidohydrolase [Reichenbachiella sp. 5M10]
MEDLTIAMLQADLFWENVDGNLAMFEEQIWSISEEVDVVLLPEMFNTGFSMRPKLLAEVPGLKTQRWMLQMAAQRQALVGGSYIVQQGQRYFNRFVFAFPEGKIQYYDKRHLFSLAQEENYFAAGETRLIVNYKGWKICPLICYDLRFPVWSRNQTREGQCDYDLLLYVANWPETRIQAWDTLLQARAIENQAYVAGVNRIGRDGNDHSYVGHSAVYDYAGDCMQGLVEEVGVIVQTISQSPLLQYRERFAFLQDGDDFVIN